MQPTKGPVRYKVSEIEQSIAAGSSLGPIKFRWPRAVFVTSLLLLPRSGLSVDMAGLRLTIEDETQQQIFASGDGSANYGAALGDTGLVTLAPLMTTLVKAAPFALQRPVNVGDLWLVTIANVGVNAVTPELLFSFDEADS